MTSILVSRVVTIRVLCNVDTASIGSKDCVVPMVDVSVVVIYISLVEHGRGLTLPCRAPCCHRIAGHIVSQIVGVVNCDPAGKDKLGNRSVMPNIGSTRCAIVNEAPVSLAGKCDALNCGIYISILVF